MTDWSDVEFFAPPLRARKTGDFLAILANLLVVWDFLSCAMTGAAALLIHLRYRVQDFSGIHIVGSFQRDIAFGAIIAALLLRKSGNDLDPRTQSTRNVVFSAQQSCLTAFFLLISIGLITRTTDDLSREWLMLWMMMFASAVGLSRFAIGEYLHRLLERGALRDSVAIIGAVGSREQMASRISDEADVIGMFAPIDDELDEEHEDGLKQLFDLGREGSLDAVILALNPESNQNMKSMIMRLKELPLQVAICSNNDWACNVTPQMRMLGGMPMTIVADWPIKQWGLFIKTLLDKIGAVFLVSILAPLMLCIALAIATTSPGPVIFRQIRRGWCGKEFVIFKFRTMYYSNISATSQTRRNDPRCTFVGRFLRRSSLDELPQLWNVISGDMSLVGPRPHADKLHGLDQVECEIVAEYAQRHRVKPGLTGWAQVNGARGATDSPRQMRRRVELDLYYIENWSLLLDFEILLRTPLVMVGKRVF